MEKKMVKIGITLEAEQALEQIQNRVNEGYTGGRLNKTNLLSWIIQQFNSQYLENDIERIRKDHFDNLFYLETVVRELREAKKNGTSPDIHSLLSPIGAVIKTHPRKKEQAPQAN